jgi:hypothetical protein
MSWTLAPRLMTGQPFQNAWNEPTGSGLNPALLVPTVTAQTFGFSNCGVRLNSITAAASNAPADKKISGRSGDPTRQR